MSRWTPAGYATKNWATFNRALKQRGSLLLWFDAALSDKQGLQQAYSNAAIQACLPIKVLFCVLLRQATGLVESLLKLIWQNWPVPTSVPCVGVKRRCLLPFHIKEQGD